MGLEVQITDDSYEYGRMYEMDDSIFCIKGLSGPLTEMTEALARLSICLPFTGGAFSLEINQYVPDVTILIHACDRKLFGKFCSRNSILSKFKTWSNKEKTYC